MERTLLQGRLGFGCSQYRLQFPYQIAKFQLFLLLELSYQALAAMEHLEISVSSW
jgi:hypothetical protein